mmetsp:Transcript_1552/g.2117  ORF Transcript_1552/g.2117 Transcript_1552/m.2117 type:complete len:194 (-) Transcript_1552:256-837(-)
MVPSHLISKAAGKRTLPGNAAMMNRSFYIVTTIAAISTAAHAFGIFRQKPRMEEVVRKYFDGVNKKDAEQIKSCFAEEATIRDVMSGNDQPRKVKAQVLADRCMEFVTAHPDCKVDFHYGPECGRNSRWVVANWWEVGTWSGESCGLKPTNKPMSCEGQTRFRVNEDFQIEEFVVFRTVTDWEQALIDKSKES